MSYEIRGGDWDWVTESPGPVWDGHGKPPAWTANTSGCGCAACVANNPSKRHHGLDGGRHHLPAAGWDDGRDAEDWVPDFPDYGGQPASVILAKTLAQRNTDPLSVYEEGRDEVVSDYAESRPSGREALIRSMNADRDSKGRTHGSLAREIVRLTEFRALP